jgi:hypothetical protein
MPSENEKLRALLAEARDGLFDPEVSHDVVRCNCWVCTLARRIDAALAEPVVECARCETLRDLADKAAWAQGLAQRRMTEAQKQRDEARAEVERLGTALTQETRLSLHTQRQLDEARAEVERLKESNKLLRVDADKEWGAAATAVATAYQRGAEAMREAAAQECWRASDELADIPDMTAEQGQAQLCAMRIRALPLPEDK